MRGEGDHQGRELLGNGDCRVPGTVGVVLVEAEEESEESDESDDTDEDEYEGGLLLMAFVNDRSNNVTSQVGSGVVDTNFILFLILFF